MLLYKFLFYWKGIFVSKKIKEEGEGEEIKKAEKILKEIETQKTTISELSIFVENNKDTQNEEKKQEIESIKKLLMNIRKEEEIIIEILNKYKILII